MTTMTTSEPEPFCASSPEAQELSEPEFWQAVFDRQNPDIDIDDDTLDPLFAQMGRCSECGEMGPCGYDAEGRAMVHVERDDSPE